KRPPTFLSLSNTVTIWPARFNCWAAANPDGPEPIIATVFPLRFFGGFALIHPSLKPRSTMYFSMSSIDTGGCIIHNTQADSQGAGHKRPVNSGKLLVECNM